MGVRRFAVLACGLVAAGCAGVQREERLAHEAEAHVYRQKPEVVWAQARALLLEQGFLVQQAERGWDMVTPWRSVVGTSDLASLRRRYRVVGGVRPDGGFVVRIFRLTRSTVSVTADHPSPLSGNAAGAGDGNASATGYSHQYAGEPLANVRPRAERDGVLEWALLQRVEPELARRLEVAADPGKLPAAPGSR